MKIICNIVYWFSLVQSWFLLGAIKLLSRLINKQKSETVKSETVSSFGELLSKQEESELQELESKYRVLSRRSASLEAMNVWNHGRVKQPFCRSDLLSLTADEQARIEKMKQLSKSRSDIEKMKLPNSEKMKLPDSDKYVILLGKTEETNIGKVDDTHLRILKEINERSKNK